MTATDTYQPPAPEEAASKMSTGKKVLIGAGVVVAVVAILGFFAYNSDTAQGAMAEVNFLTEVEEAFGVPQFDGMLVNDNGEATLRDAGYACVLGSSRFMDEWNATGNPEAAGLLFVNIVEDSSICDQM